MGATLPLHCSKQATQKMRKVGRSKVLCRLLGHFFVTLSLFSIQLALSGGRESPADDSSVFSFSEDGRGDVHSRNEDAVSGSGAVIAREPGYGTSSPGAAGKPWRSDSVSRRRRRGPLSTSTSWPLSEKRSRTQSSLRVANVLKAATLAAATILVLWRLGEVVWRCLDKSYTATKYVGTTPRLLRKSKKSSASTGGGCPELAHGAQVAGVQPTGAHPSGNASGAQGGNPFDDEDESTGNPSGGAEDYGVGNPFLDVTGAEGTGNPFEIEDMAASGNPFDNEDDAEGNTIGNDDAPGAQGTPFGKEDDDEEKGPPGREDERTQLKGVGALGRTTPRRRHSARAILSLILTVASVSIILAGIIGATVLVSEQAGAPANATGTSTANETAPTATNETTTTNTSTAALILSFALVCGAALRVLYGFREAHQDLRSGLERAGRSLPLLKLLASMTLLITVSALAILAAQQPSPLAVYLLDVVAVAVVVYLIFPYLVQLVAQARGRRRTRDV